MTGMDEQSVTAATRRWVADLVIGLNLCPFARRVFDGGLIRYAVTAATNEADLLAALEVELHTLTAAPRSEIETTLLIHPHVLPDFRAYQDAVEAAEERVASLGLEGVIQIAGFHPH